MTEPHPPNVAPPCKKEEDEEKGDEKPNILIISDSKKWNLINKDEDPARPFVVPMKFLQKGSTIAELLNNFDHFAKLHPENEAIKTFGPARQVLQNMAKTVAGWETATAVFVPFLFITRLSSDVIFRVQEMNENHEKFDETKFDASVPREPLDYMFKIVRSIDREPQKYAFGFIYSITDQNILPVCSAFCGSRQDTNISSLLDQLAEKVEVKNLATDEQKMSQPKEYDQKRDAAIIIAVLRSDPESAKKFESTLEKGLRGRLLIIKHDKGVSSRYQPLTTDLQTQLEQCKQPGDRTLEWIQSFDTKTNMVVTVQDSFAPNSAARSYLMMQPWKVDSHFFDQTVGSETHCGKGGCGCHNH